MSDKMEKWLFKIKLMKTLRSSPDKIREEIFNLIEDPSIQDELKFLKYRFNSDGQVWIEKKEDENK